MPSIVCRKSFSERRRLQAEVRTALEEVILVTNDLSLADVIWLTEYEDLDLGGHHHRGRRSDFRTAVLSQTLFIPAVVGVAGQEVRFKTAINYS